MQSDTPPTVPRAARACFVFACWDGPDSAARRVADLNGHLAHVERHWRRYVVAGPMRDPDGDVIVGSMFLVLADTVEDAWALMKGDPYIESGMYARIDVRHFTQAIGLAVGGKIWDSWDTIRDRAAGGPPIAKT
jgi:uncharacterized protein YciI